MSDHRSADDATYRRRVRALRQRSAALGQHPERVGVAAGVVPADVGLVVGRERRLVDVGAALAEQRTQVGRHQIPAEVVLLAAVGALDGDAVDAGGSSDSRNSASSARSALHVGPLVVAQRRRGSGSSEQRCRVRRVAQEGIDGPSSSSRPATVGRDTTATENRHLVGGANSAPCPLVPRSSRGPGDQAVVIASSGWVRAARMPGHSAARTPTTRPARGTARLAPRHAQRVQARPCSVRVNRLP